MNPGIVRRVPVLAAGLLAAMMTPAALAHTGGHGASAGPYGLWAGLAHPFTGLDHLLAMVALGMLAAVVPHGGGRILLGSLVGLGAGILGAAWLPEVSVEVLLGLSVAGLGALLASGSRMPSLVGAASGGVFAAVHGYVHALEMPVGGMMALYGAGLTLGSLVLLALGYGLARSPIANGPARAAVGLSLAGAGMALTGLAG